MNKLSLIALLAGVAVAAPAFAADEKVTEKHVIKKEDAAGTKTKQEVSKKYEKNEDGSSVETVKTEEVKDPKGLMNKEKSETKEVVKKDAAGNVIEAEKEVDGKKVEAAPAAGKMDEKH